jgi:membrane-associated protease RseP (regulator of RpoE activity)
LSDTGDPITVAEAETPAQAPQTVSVPQTESSPRGDGWFKRGVRSGVIAAIVVVVAGAFFTIGWFTSTRGEDGHLTVMNGINQQKSMGERGGSQGGADQRGTNQWQRCPRRGGGMIAPQQGQGQNQTVPGVPSQSNSQSNQQGYLGVGIRTVTPALQGQYGLSRSNGALVASVDGSGPAVKAGIQQGDIITSVDGASVIQQEDVIALVAKKKAGDSVSVTIDRNGMSLTLQVTLVEMPASVVG